MSWLVGSPDIELVAKILTLMKNPTSQNQMRKKLGLSAWTARLLLDKLVKAKVLKLYAQKPFKKRNDEARVFLIARKGDELLTKYRLLLKVLRLDPENPEALRPIPCEKRAP